MFSKDPHILRALTLKFIFYEELITDTVEMLLNCTFHN